MCNFTFDREIFDEKNRAVCGPENPLLKTWILFITFITRRMRHFPIKTE